MGAQAHTLPSLTLLYPMITAPYSTIYNMLAPLIYNTNTNRKTIKTPPSEASGKKESLKVKHKQYYRTKWLALADLWEDDFHQSKIDTPS